MNYNVGVIAGDGIGPEIVSEARKVLDAIGAKFGHTFTYDEILMGGCSIDATGVPLTDDAIACKSGRCSSDGFHRRKYSNIPLVQIRAIPSPGGRSFEIKKSIEPFCKLKTGIPL